METYECFKAHNSVHIGPCPSSIEQAPERLRFSESSAAFRAMPSISTHTSIRYIPYFNSLPHHSTSSMDAQMESTSPAQSKTVSSAPKKQVSIQSRCNPGQHVRLLDRFKDNNDFKNALQEMGLEGFLELRLSRLQRELCGGLASRVHIPTRMLNVHGRQIKLTYSSVTDVLGLRSNGLAIPSNVRVDEESLSSTCERFRLPPSGRVSVYELLSYLEEAPTVDEEFKCKYLLFSIATMLRPTSNVHIYFREFVPLMSRLKVLSTFNWAKFVLDALLDAIHTFQNKSCKSIRGCIIYLQILYLHHISAPSRGLHDECLLRSPWLAVWTDERAKTYYKVVEDLGGVDNEKVCVNVQGKGADHEPIKGVYDQLMEIEETIQTVKRKQVEESYILREDVRKILRCIEAVKEGLQKYDVGKIV